MQDLTTAGQHTLSDAATKHGFSEDAAGAVLRALQKGNGMAQFNHPELGGMGQWSSGMVMIGDMGNSGLKSRVDALCHDLADALNHGGVFHEAANTTNTAGAESPRAGTSGNWWPSELGSPSSSGAQNDMRYAVFPAAHRIAVQSGGRVTVYDSGAHAIHGVSQAQGGSQTLVFSSQQGQVSTADLPVVKS